MSTVEIILLLLTKHNDKSEVAKNCMHEYLNWFTTKIMHYNLRFLSAISEQVPLSKERYFEIHALNFNLEDSK